MELPIVGYAVARVAFDRYAVWLELQGGPESCALRIGGPLRLLLVSTTLMLDPEEGPHPELLRLLGRAVAAAEASEDGGLRLAFDDNSLVEVDPGPYETWQLSGPGAYEAVSVAGGGIETFEAAAADVSPPSDP